MAGSCHPTNAVVQELRIALIWVSIVQMGVFVVCLIMRLIEKPGSIRQDELDAVEAQKMTDDDMKELNYLFGRQKFTSWDGKVYGRDQLFQQNMQA